MIRKWEGIRVGNETNERAEDDARVVGGKRYKKGGAGELSC